MIDEADSLSRPLCLFVEEDIMKRFFTILIAIIVLALTVMPLAASAAEATDPNYIYFEVPTATASWPKSISPAPFPQFRNSLRRRTST